MTKLIDLQSQIEKLQQQADEIRKREFTSTVSEIHKLMAAYGISIKDLQAPKGKEKAVRKAKNIPAKTLKLKKNKTAVEPKFRGPNGESWSGRGLMPKWLATLVAAGQTKDSFLIAKPSESHIQ